MTKKESTKDAIVRKLTSRKLWAAIASFVGMLIVALGYSESEAATITALIMAGATVIAYIIGEGLIDAANISSDNVTTDETKEK